MLGRIGARVQHARHDARATTAAGRSAFLSRFEHDVDPDGRLDPVERRRRAESARKAHFARMSFRSAQARKTGKARARRADLSERPSVEALDRRHTA